MMPVGSPAPRKSLGRDLALWGGSFLMAATALVIYLRAPILPLLAAGVVTLAITFFRHRAGPR